MKKIIRNSAECFQCGEHIESKSVHDFKSCSCGNIMVDGGKEYLKRVGDIHHKNSKDTSITQEVPKCVILSGPSGAGKSTWVEEEYHNSQCLVVSADHFFMADGAYKFNPAMLSQAHNACLRKFIEACQAGAQEAEKNLESPVVVVDNTNTTVEEIAPYYSVAKAYGYDVELVTFQLPVELAAKRNTHGVPFQSVQAMADRIKARVIPRFWNLKQINCRWVGKMSGGYYEQIW